MKSASVWRHYIAPNGEKNTGAQSPQAYNPFEMEAVAQNKRHVSHLEANAFMCRSFSFRRAAAEERVTTVQRKRCVSEQRQRRKYDEM